VSTKDPTDLRRLGWDTDGATLGALLRTGRWLPDLHGWTIRFTGIGDVAGAQPQLTDPLRERLADLWLGICKACGAAACTVDREYVGQAAPTSTSATPVVEPPAPRVEDDAAWLPASTLFAIGRADVGPDADVVLQAVADRMLATDRTARIVGHTDASTGTDAVNLRLSRGRAEAVRDRLVELGVPADRIVEAVGVGSRGADPEAERAEPRLISLHRNVEIRFGTR
jgi:outer membrane protein OmpA-like peptidoglycan-associated protein